MRTPDLWSLSPAQVKKARPGTEPQGGVSLPIAQAHSTLEPLEALTDGDMGTIASAPMPLARDQFVLVDLGATCDVFRVVLRVPEGAAPVGRVRIDAAGSHNFPYQLVYVGEPNRAGMNAILRKPARCRFLRITLLEPSGEPWTLSEIQLDGSTLEGE